MLPIAEREMRIAARQPRTYRSRVSFAAISVLIFAWMLWTMRFGRGPTGAEMFQAFSWMAFVYCLFTGVAITVDSVSSEKRENTLGLLFLTHLKGHDIIIGKLLASSLSCFFGLLAVFPVLAIPLIMGGVQLAEFGKIALNLGNTLLLSVSVGLLVSTLSRHPLRGAGFALLAVAFLGFGLAGLSELIRIYYKLPELAASVELFSPFSCQIKAGRLFWVRSNNFWPSLLAIHLTALSFLALSCWIVPWTWKDKPGGKRTFSLRERMRRWKFGTSTASRAFRTRLLELNPFFWLAARERVSSLEFLILLIGFVSVGTWAAWRVGLEFSGPIKPLGGFVFVWLWTALLLHGILLFRMALAATHRLAEDRHSGALELLLATPFDSRRIVRGQWLAYARQMAGPIVVVLLAQGFFLWGLVEMFILEEGRRLGLKTHWELLRTIWRGSIGLDPDIASGLAFGAMVIVAITVLVAACWITVGWVGMWIGVRAKRPRAAPWVTLALVLIPPWPIFGLIVYILEELSQFWSEFDLVYLYLRIGFGLGLLHTVILSVWAWWKLRTRFRIAVTDRFLFLNTRRTWPQRFRLAARFALILACLAALFPLWHKVENWRGQKAWNNFQQELKASGENLDIHAVLPPSVPADQNFGAAPLWEPVFGFKTSTNKLNIKQTSQGLSALQSINLEGQPQTWWNYGNQSQGNWREQKGLDLTALRKHFRGRIQFPKPPAASEPADEVLFALSKFDVKLEEFEAAGQRPLCQFPIDFGQPRHRYDFMSHVIILRNVGEVLQVRACALLPLGKSAEAFKDVQLILRFVEALRSEPLVQSNQARHELISFAIQALWEGLAAERWSPEQLAALQTRFQHIDLLADYQQTVRSEIMLQIDAWDRLRAIISGNGEPRRAYGYHPGRWVLKPFYPSGRTYYHQITAYRLYQTKLLPVIDPEARRVFMDKALALEHALAKTDAFTDNRTMRWTLRGFADGAARLQAALHQAQLACALERYRLAQKGYPESLGALAPQFLNTIPHDIVNGEPLIYKRTEDARFELYSVGSNEKDDGGIARNELDWVWRYPRK